MIKGLYGKPTTNIPSRGETDISSHPIRNKTRRPTLAAAAAHRAARSSHGKARGERKK